jgi:hypothetical protein
MSMDMLIVVDQGINDVLKDFDFPDLDIRIGIDSGEIAVIEYAVDKVLFANVGI